MGPDADPEAAIRLVRFHEYCLRGKHRLGEGWNNLGIWLPRVHVECDFFHPVTLDELLVVEAFFGKIGRSSIHLNFEVHRKENSDVIVATGKYVLVTVKKGQLAPTPVPNMLREKLQPYVEESSNGTRRQRSAR